LKIYIHTDLEGISGIDDVEMIEKHSPHFRYCCEMLMLDTNAAVEGAFAGGATTVTVLDSHGSKRNFIPELLDPRAEIDPREGRIWWGKMDHSYGGTFFIGAHAMAGTQRAFLEHTQSLSWHDFSVNGRRMGELAQWALVSGHWGVPLVMVSGDAAACAEAREFFDPIETAVVKSAEVRNRAVLVDPEEARDHIRTAAMRAVSLCSTAKPFAIPGPLEMVLEFNRVEECEQVADHPKLERVDARTVRWIAESPLDVFP